MSTDASQCPNWKYLCQKLEWFSCFLIITVAKFQIEHSWKVPGVRSASKEQVSKLRFCIVYYFLHIGISNFLPLSLLQTPTWRKQSCRMLLYCGYLCCSTAWWLVVPSDSSVMTWTCQPFWGPCTPSALAVLCRYELITRNPHSKASCGIRHLYEKLLVPIVTRPRCIHHLQYEKLHISIVTRPRGIRHLQYEKLHISIASDRCCVRPKNEARFQYRLQDSRPPKICVAVSQQELFC